MSDMPAELLGETQSPQSSDRLVALRVACESLRDAEAEVTDLEERLKQAKARRLKISVDIIPDKMDEAGVVAVELAARGNHAAVRVEVKPFVAANIAVAWSDEKRREAFDWLDANKSGDLIKTVVEVAFHREDRERALQIATKLRELRLGEVTVSESVHSATLGSWLRERVKKKLATPLDIIGGVVGRVAKVVPK